MSCGFASTDLVSGRSGLVGLHVCWCASPASPPAPTRARALHTSPLSAAPQAPQQYLWRLHCSRLPCLGIGLQFVVQASTSACTHVTRRRAWGVRPPLVSKTRTRGLRIAPLALTHTDAFILALAQLRRAQRQAQALLVSDPEGLGRHIIPKRRFRRHCLRQASPSSAAPSPAAPSRGSTLSGSTRLSFLPPASSLSGFLLSVEAPGLLS